MNKEQILMNLLNSNPNIQNNPLFSNAINMMKNGDNTGLENMARNLCNERGININDMINKINNMFNSI